MITIKKTDDSDLPYVLHLGEHQQFPMSEISVRDLHHCMTKTIHDGAKDVPTTHFRILSGEQYDSGIFSEGRCTLWVGDKKWHIRLKEEKLLEDNLSELIKELD